MMKVIQLFKLFALSRVSVAQAWPKDLATRMTIVIGCAVSAIMLINIALGYGLYWIYQYAIASGFDPGSVKLVMALSIAAVITIALCIASLTINKMKSDVKVLTTRTVPLTDHITRAVRDIVDGFVDGLTSKP